LIIMIIIMENGDIVDALKTSSSLFYFIISLLLCMLTVHKRAYLP